MFDKLKIGWNWKFAKIRKIWKSETSMKLKIEANWENNEIEIQRNWMFDKIEKVF